MDGSVGGFIATSTYCVVAASALGSCGVTKSLPSSRFVSDSLTLAEAFPMHDTIVTAPGSLGDVNPLLGIARSLQDAGCKVMFSAAEPYLHLAERAGLKVHPLTSAETFARMVGNPKVWHPRHGLRVIFDEAVRDSLDKHYAWLEANSVPGKTLLVSHSLDFAGRVYRDRYPETKLATVVLQPSVLRSLIRPPRVSAHGWERRVPRVMWRFSYWCADRWIDSLAGRHINRLRGRIGLGAVRSVIKDWWLSPDLTLAMFPDWFSIPAQELPPQAETVGFPLVDSADYVDPKVDYQLQRLLSAGSGEKPVVFIPGTAHHHCKTFLTMARDACVQLKLPAVLVSTKPEQVPDDLPPGIVTAQYLPFSKLLPHCQSAVHHGGVGTTSQCFAAGVPQVVLPMAFDQFDNAERVMELGCGSWMPMRKLTVARLVEHLQRLRQSGRSSDQIAQRFEGPRDAVRRAAERILKLYDGRRS
jgi:rhamnosyltransferase subunit B